VEDAGEKVCMEDVDVVAVRVVVVVVAGMEMVEDNGRVERPCTPTTDLRTKYTQTNRTEQVGLPPLLLLVVRDFIPRKEMYENRIGLLSRTTNSYYFCVTKIVVAVTAIIVCGL
jgi:hypothetical protein